MNQTAVDARHEAFCQEYAKDFNAHRAQVAAGYSDKSQGAHMLLQRPEIVKRVREIVEARKKNYETDIVLMLDELRLIAMMNVNDFPKDENGDVDLNRLTPEQGRCIAAVESFSGKFGSGRKIKFYNKLEALLAFLKLNGLIDLPKPISGPDDDDDSEDIIEFVEPKRLNG